MWETYMTMYDYIQHMHNIVIIFIWVCIPLNIQIYFFPKDISKILDTENLYASF